MPTKPVYKLEVYTPDDDLRVSIEKFATNIQTTRVMTNGIGRLKFNLNMAKSPRFRKIKPFDKIKVYMGWNTVPSTPDWVGRITNIRGLMNDQVGKVRVITGVDLGEILGRRLVTNLDYEDTGAASITEDLADALSIGDSLIDIIYTCSGDGNVGGTTTVCATLTEADDYWNGYKIKALTGDNAGEEVEVTDFDQGTATLTHSAFTHQQSSGDTFRLSLPETLLVDIDKHEKYHDFLKKVSDYWVDASNKVQKDFYVDDDFKLVWKSRPFRTLDERLVEGKNIISYDVVSDINEVFNRLWVYGDRTAYFRRDADWFTESKEHDRHTTVDANSNSGTYILYITDTTDFYAGQYIYISGGAGNEYNTVASVDPGVSVTVETALSNNYVNTDDVYGYPSWSSGFAGCDIESDAVDYKFGSYSIHFEDNGAPSHIGGKCEFGESINLNHYPKVSFWLALIENTSDPHYGWISLKDADANECTYSLPICQSVAAFGNDGCWNLHEIGVGRGDRERWQDLFGMDWTAVTEFWVRMEEQTLDLYIDGLSFGGRHHRCSDTGYIEDATSQSLYGTREAAFYDDDLVSRAMCQSRAQRLLWQLKDIVKRVDIQTFGTKRIQVGDQLPLTIVDENINSENFQVLSVSQLMSGDHWRTQYSLIDSTTSRKVAPKDIQEYLTWRKRISRKVDRGEKLVM